jgi:hypothetical protein
MFIPCGVEWIITVNNELWIVKDILRTNIRYYKFIASERLSKPMKILKIFHTLTYKKIF